MRAYRFALSIGMFLLCFACGKTTSERLQPTPPSPPASEEPPQPESADNLPATPAQTLAARLAAWPALAPLCGDFPAKENCDDGDATLFNGLLCSAGFTLGCDSVRRAQGPNGQWFRSPARVPTANFLASGSFSRDMALGVLLYLAQSRDEAAAKKWLDWIDDNRPCALENPTNGQCSVYGLHRLCRDDSDNRCTITPTLWSVMAEVWDAAGWKLHDEMKRYRGTYASTAVTEANNTSPGFELHLKAVQAFLMTRLGKNSETAAKVITAVNGKQPANPFFSYLAGTVNDAWVSNFLNLCPDPAADQASPRKQWSWERDTASEAWRESMVWDCLFLGKLAQGVLQARS